MERRSWYAEMHTPIFKNNPPLLGGGFSWQLLDTISLQFTPPVIEIWPYTNKEWVVGFVIAFTVINIIGTKIRQG